MNVALDLGPNFSTTPDGFLLERDPITGNDAWYQMTERRPLPWRYILQRHRRMPSTRGGRRFCVFCGLNPSTATALEDDATIRRCISFAWAWGCDTYTMVNAYAWRDTKPANMWLARKRGEHVVGERNDQCIIAALQTVERSGGIAVAAWGAHIEPDRQARLLELAREVGVRWKCLGKNAAGTPKHPLYIAANTPLVSWPDEDDDSELYFDIAERRVVAWPRPMVDEDVFDDDD